MGAGGHSVIISSNAQEFLHVHPVKEVSANWNGGSDVYFKANFPIQVLYKVWGQFRHDNKTITADFILEVLNYLKKLIFLNNRRTHFQIFF